MLIQFLVKARYQGAAIKVGEVLDLPEEIAEQLKKEGSAEDAQEALETAKGETGGNGPANTQPPAAGPGSQEKGDGNADPVALLKKALDDQYKRDELAEAAKAIGVEFKYDAKKAEIIDAAVAQGKAEALKQ